MHVATMATATATTKTTTTTTIKTTAKQSNMGDFWVVLDAVAASVAIVIV